MGFDSGSIVNEGTRRRTAIGKQLDGSIVGEPTDRDHDLAAEAERLAAGGDHAQIGNLAEQRFDHRRRLGDHMFTVVQHDHERAPAQMADQQAERR